MTNAKEVFAELKKFFNDLDIDVHEKIKVWNVLSALRGPDVNAHSTENDHIKAATTLLIREQLLGTNHTNLLSFPKLIPDNQTLVDIRTQLSYTRGQKHFEAHARDAFEAFGLKWESVNVNEIQILHK